MICASSSTTSTFFLSSIQACGQVTNNTLAVLSRFDPDPAAVRLNDAADYCQSHAEAFLTFVIAIATIEPFEDRSSFRFGNARPFILDSEAYIIVLFFGPDMD